MTGLKSITFPPVRTILKNSGRTVIITGISAGCVWLISYGMQQLFLLL